MGAVPNVATRQRFKEAFNATGGVSGAAKLLGISKRAADSMRRKIEAEDGVQLLSTDIRSPDYGSVSVEFEEWQQLDIKDGYLIAFGDAHLTPGSKSSAHRALLKLIKELKPEALVDLGDLMDFSALGRYHRIGWDQRLTIKQEIEWAGDCLEEMKKLGPKRMRTRRTRGNHDQRFAGALANRVPEIEGIRGTTLEDHLPGWHCTWSIMVNDQACLTHRWKGGIHGPHNNALWSGTSYVTGHQHKQQCYPLTDLKGDRWGVDAGTLATIWNNHFRYLEGKPRNWRSGFVVLRFVKGQLRHPEFLRVVDERKGLVEWRGQDYFV